MESWQIPCPGCGLSCPAYMADASFQGAHAFCWLCFGQLLARSPTVPLLLPHTYALQHPYSSVIENTQEQRKLGLSLSALCLLLDHEVSEMRCSKILAAVAAQEISWPQWQPPPSFCGITCKDVLLGEAGEEEWSRCVYGSWSIYHDLVYQITIDLLAHSIPELSLD